MNCRRVGFLAKGGEIQKPGSTLRVLAVRFAVETHRPLCNEAVQLLCDLGGRLFVSPATTASVFFNQRISCSVCVAARWFLSVDLVYCTMMHNRMQRLHKQH